MPTQSNYSLSLQREMVWLSGQLPYAAASAVAQRVGGWTVPLASLWDRTQAHGQRLLVADQHHQQQVSPERTLWNQRDYAPARQQAVSMDGGMVHVRGEGWKELKVGMVADIVPRVERREDDDACLTQLHYTAVLGDVARFEPCLWALAVQQGVPYTGTVAVTADGAAWIWNTAAHLFPQSTQIVDWYHACQHLSAAAQTRFPTDALAAKRWTDQLKGHLFKGEIHLILAQFEKYHLTAHGDYFREHQLRMHYALFRAQGLPIGSGGVESAVKQFKHRLTGPGMRWCRTGLDRMVILRTAVLDGTFDQRWCAA